MTADKATQETAVDPADIGPEDLWLVWYSTLPLLQDLGDEPVGTSWVLAARGPEGLNSLKKERAYGDRLVAAFPLSILQAMRDSLSFGSSKGLVGWARNALNTDRLLFVLDEQGNGKVAARESELGPGEKLVLSGDRKDLVRMVSEGEEILAQKNWRKVFSDHRPFVKHGEVGWLHYQRNPRGAELMQKLLDGVDFHDL